MEEKHKIRMYTPFKYFKGLTTISSVKKRLTEMKNNRHKTDVSKIKYSTDKEKKTVKKSKYHQAFEERFQISSSASLEQKSKVTGVPLPILKKSFKKVLPRGKQDIVSVRLPSNGEMQESLVF